MPGAIVVTLSRVSSSKHLCPYHVVGHPNAMIIFVVVVVVVVAIFAIRMELPNRGATMTATGKQQDEAKGRPACPPRRPRACRHGVP